MQWSAQPNSRSGKRSTNRQLLDSPSAYENVFKKRMFDKNDIRFGRLFRRGSYYQGGAASDFSACNASFSVNRRSC